MPIDFHLRLPDFITQHANFFRIHLTFFTITPIIFACIFYGSNGSSSSVSETGLGIQKVSFIDSLFLCYSAMTVTGLVTINVSSTKPFQQVLLFILFLLGDYSVVSLVMVLVRKRFFRSHCVQLLRSNNLHRSRTLPNVFTRSFTFNPSKPGLGKKDVGDIKGEIISGPIAGGFVPGIEEERVRVDSPIDIRDENRGSEGDSQQGTTAVSSGINLGRARDRDMEIAPSDTMGEGGLDMNRYRTIQIDEPYQTRQRLRAMSVNPNSPHNPSVSVNRKSSNVITHIPAPYQTKHSGFGGFPTPFQFFPTLFPRSTNEKLRNRLSRTETQMTMLTNPRKGTMDGKSGGESWGEDVKGYIARWMPENLGGLVVGRNSRFYTEELEDEELEVLGGVEYRALRLLGYLVGAYIILFQVIPFAIIAIYFSKIYTWDPAFQATQAIQSSTVNKTWSSLFLTVAAYTGSGMSLIDQSMSPFAKCYLLIYILDLVMLAGNHALPMTLRLIIWLGTKVYRKGTTNETLHFLLDHPRRCFLYLFPSHQTWYLVFTLCVFIGIEMFGFLVLNIGLPVLTSLENGWEMFSDGLLQSLSVRAAGFGISPIATMAPSVLFLYIILMYVAIYPIAMSVRSTNVYEERALGVYEQLPPDMASEEEPAFKGRRREVFSKYLLWHMRRQLAFDIWPLTLAIFLICCLERGKLLDPAKSTWFTVFRIIFECTSAYSTIGLSMGTPNNNFSFSGEFSTVSKLVMILVMLRGRHRGLPVAIDRAILLPREYQRLDKRETDLNSGPAPVPNNKSADPISQGTTEGHDLLKMA